MTIRSTDSQSALDKANKRRTTLTFIVSGCFLYFAYFNLAIGSSEIHAKHIFEYFLHL